MSNNEIVPGFNDEINENLRITLQTVPELLDGLVLNLVGSIDTYNSMSFYEQMSRLIEAGYTQLFFHCGELEHISSTGIGSLTALLKTVKAKSGAMTFFEMGQELRDMLGLLGFGEVFTVADGLSDALGLEYVSSCFPCNCVCPSCDEQARAEKPGRFRCGACGAVITIDILGQTSLG
jgi:anti-anti-sigma factor